MPNGIKGSIRNPEMRDILREMALRNQIFVAPAASANYFDASQALAADTGGVYVLTVLAAGMDKTVPLSWPVCPVIVVTDAAENLWASVSIELTGIDQFGDQRTETIAATNAGGTWTGTAKHAYLKLIKCVTTVTVTSSTVAAGDSQVIGFAKTYGLGARIAAATDVKTQTFGGAADAGTISAVYHTVAIAGTPDGAKLSCIVMRPTAY